MHVARKRTWRRFFNKEFAPLYLMALPVFVYLLIFNYAPMVGVLMAFQRFNSALGFFRSQFVGLRNFRFLFSTTDAYIITRNTVLYNVAYIVTGMFLSITVAIVLSSLRTKRTGKVYQTIYMMPYFLSWAAVGIALNAFLASRGIINQVIGSITGEPTRTNWYLVRSFWPPFLIFIKNWKEIGYSVVLYLAIISGIPTEFYEAAMIDGATKFQQTRFITIPHLRFIISISLILAMRGIVSGDFGLHFIVTRDSGPIYPVTDIIDTYVYRSLIQLQNVGMSAAANLYQSVIGMVMMLVANWTVTKIDPDNAFF